MANADRNTQQSVSPAAALWQIVVADYQTALTEHNRLTAENRAAEEAAKAEAGEPDPDFETYGVNGVRPQTRLDRIAFIREVEMNIAINDFRGRSDISAEEYAGIAHKAAQLVDAAEAYWLHCEEVYARIEGIEERWEKQLDGLCAARNKVWATPAPDPAAMIYKLELLTDYMIEGCDDLGGEVRAIRDDAKRLFGEVA